MIIEGNTIYPDEGKLLRRKNTNYVYDEPIVLGYSYYINGVLQNPPHKDVPEDFEDVTEEDLYNERKALYPGLVEQYIREMYTVSDEFAIQRQRDEKPEKFQEYFEFCEDCKRRAKNDLNL